MKRKKFANKKASHIAILEQKLLKLIKRYHPEISVFGRVILEKADFNALASFVRFTPSEVLELAEDFRTLEISNYGTRWIKVELKGG